ncbi:hypothetical protein CSC2_29610 [Clostridium zeae]|uniref:Homing endonuclease LAGLIDADG domain-containing protein n=1 Tax=Clostridium zeae TaxID=2759022 RepID=A0ABQ1ECD9_9CLOT|nr:LAGLIDADG family homing endonuclease [Clostridium zeae]GFZ32435.1 hypothetical protein CSC2_29610 [Clostridium zeae]
MLTNEEKAYIAGIIDGEGSIMLTSFHSNELHSPCVSIASTTLELLQWIKDKTNTGVIKRKKNYNTERHKDCFSYTLRYNDAINFLEMISPYLVIESKKRRALMIINEYKSLTPRNGRYSEELLEKKRKFYERFIALK